MDSTIRLISVSDIEEQYLNQTEVLGEVKGYKCNVDFPSIQQTPPPCEHCSFQNAVATFKQSIESLAKEAAHESVFFLVDDLHFLGETDFSILQTVRELRSFIENHFTVSHFPLHPLSYLAIYVCHSTSLRSG